MTLAVVGDPSTDEVLVAQAGHGAWALTADGDIRRLRASPDTETVVIEDSHAEGARRDQAARFVAAAVRADRWDLRSLSTTLSLAYVAAGRVSGYALFWTSAVHAAAGSLLATEAGAIVTDLAGRPWTIDWTRYWQRPTRTYTPNCWAWPTKPRCSDAPTWLVPTLFERRCG